MLFLDVNPDEMLWLKNIVYCSARGFLIRVSVPLEVWTPKCGSVKVVRWISGI